jgi:pimeloyl-ACP methyl ester carboxylesterase
MQPHLEIAHQYALANQSRPPLLFIHGAWHGAWCWEENFLPFFVQRDFDVAAVSLRGHGRSEGREQITQYSLNNYVDDIKTAINQFSRPPILIGHSLGGLVAQKYVSIYGTSSIAGLFLIGSVPPNGIKGVLFQKIFFRHTIRSFQLFILGLGEKVLRDTVFLKKVFFSSATPDVAIQKYSQKMQNESRRLIPDLLTPSIKIPASSLPIGVMGGEFDYMVKKSIIKAIAKYFHVNAIFVPTGHDVMLDVNWEVAASSLLNWIKRYVYASC